MRRPAQAFYQKLLMLSGYAITIHANHRFRATSNHLSLLDEVGVPLVNRVVQRDRLAICCPQLLLVHDMHPEGRHRIAAWPSCQLRLAHGQLALHRQPFRHLELAACSPVPSILEGRRVNAISRGSHGQGCTFHGVAVNPVGVSFSTVRSWNQARSQQLRNIVQACAMHAPYVPS